VAYFPAREPSPPSLPARWRQHPHRPRPVRGKSRPCQSRSARRLREVFSTSCEGRGCPCPVAGSRGTGSPSRNPAFERQSLPHLVELDDSLQPAERTSTQYQAMCSCRLPAVSRFVPTSCSRDNSFRRERKCSSPADHVRRCPHFRLSCRALSTIKAQGASHLLCLRPTASDAHIPCRTGLLPGPFFTGLSIWLTGREAEGFDRSAVAASCGGRLVPQSATSGRRGGRGFHGARRVAGASRAIGASCGCRERPSHDRRRPWSRGNRRAKGRRPEARK
jgi:hypothetical protein